MLAISVLVVCGAVLACHLCLDHSRGDPEAGGEEREEGSRAASETQSFLKLDAASINALRIANSGR